ncbi:MAG: Wzz/FepE/Etk N-terminal domain-containing protein [Gemmobacter sp.]
MGPIQTIDEFLGLLLRRRLLIAAVTVALSVLVLLYAATRPVIYEAASVIQVETPTIADGSATPAAGASAQRLQTIQQRLTTRESLLAMIDRHGLYEGLPITNDEKVHLLRLAVRFQPVASVASQGYGAPQQVSALIIFAQGDTADKAARVANDFAQGVLDASAQGQNSRTREALTFFVEENKRLETQIEATEAEIAAYRNANADGLPEVREARRDEIRDIEADLREIEQALVTLQSEKARIGQGRTLRDADLQQIAALEAQEGLLQSQKVAQEERRAALVSALTRGPGVEQTLATIARRLEQLQEQYAQASQRLTEAETAQKLEERQQSERFALLERAVSPEYPVTGGRRKLAMAGAVASLMAGIIAAFVLDVMNPVLRTRTQFERALGLRPVVVIPDLPLSRGARRSAGPTVAPLARRAWSAATQRFAQATAGGAGAPWPGVSRQALLGGVAALVIVLMGLAVT